MLLRSLKSYCLTREQYQFHNLTRSDLDYEKCIEQYLQGDENANPMKYLAEFVDEYENANSNQIKMDF